MSARPLRRLPFDALAVTNVSEFARRVGVTRRTVTRWKRLGGVPVTQADRVAIRIGSHPGLIWSSWWDE